MKSKILIVGVLVLMAGCQTSRGIREVHKAEPPRMPVTAPLPGIETAPPVDITVPQQSVLPAPDTSMLATYPQTAESMSGAAVLSLLKQASDARAMGQPGQATASLERALRIEPRNYFVWSALAATYLQAKDYEQAESVAKKSNNLARGNVYAELENWRVIHEVRIARGDADAAVQAQQHVDEIEQLLAAAQTQAPALAAPTPAQ